MSTERTHDDKDAVAEPAPRLVAPAPSLGGNHALARVTGNRARAALLSRIAYGEDGLINEPIRSHSPLSSPLRDAIMENAASLVPATEGEAKFYLGVDKASIDKGREWAKGRGTTYTDCIDFAIRRLAIGMAKVGKKGALPSPVFPDASKAFKKAYQGMPPDLRPSPGDIFVMHSGTAKDATADSGNFAHTGVIKEILPGGDSGPEQWTSYDGGQGSAATLQHLEVTRTYTPDTNMYGGKILYGWIDVDLV